MEFPLIIKAFGVGLHPHPLFEVLASVLGFRLYLREKRRLGDVIPTVRRQSVIVACALGALIGAKLSSWCVDPEKSFRALDQATTWFGGKSIVGALLGGWIAIDVFKAMAGIKVHTGDVFALALVLAIGVGRIGCFLTGLDDATYGIATSLPWGVDFGDGVSRHPTQLYEILFLCVLFSVIRWRSVRPFRNGHLWRLFAGSYFGWRLMVDFIKPYPRFAGLGGLQWLCCMALAYVALQEWHARHRRPADPLTMSSAPR